MEQLTLTFFILLLDLKRSAIILQRGEKDKVPLTPMRYIVPRQNLVASALFNCQMTQQKSDSKSNSTMSTSVPYYGSREPKQSVTETDRLIFQMIDDMSKMKDCQLKEEEQEVKEELQIQKYHPTTIWRIRITLISVMVILIVVATILVSELTKEGS
ncbi:hypothetical protein BD560DRAFT_465931 [Blakeslea trispora]|nr:hypothetical protein BD560DRAFT_465931 [Blakeslea trispora]